MKFLLLMTIQPALAQFLEWYGVLFILGMLH